MAADLTHHELHQQAIAAGLEEPAIVGGVNLDEATVTTGVGLGFRRKAATTLTTPDVVRSWQP